MDHRFFAPQDQISSSKLSLAADEANHLTRVLRIGVGAHVCVFDGAGREYECRVEVASRSRVELKIIGERDDQVEAPLRLTLAQALIKSDKFDWVTQKATELGVSQIIPLVTTHSEILRSEEHGEKRIKRWERISLEALKQCGRRRLVEIRQPMSWDQYCTTESSEVKVLLSERDGVSLTSVAAGTAHPARSVSLAIGPEGGWDENEIEVARNNGLVAVHLGPRILRTETAAIAGATLVQFLFGDLNQA